MYSLNKRQDKLVKICFDYRDGIQKDKITQELEKERAIMREQALKEKRALEEKRALKKAESQPKSPIDSDPDIQTEEVTEESQNYFEILKDKCYSLLEYVISFLYLEKIFV
jgi:hypothetical protein